MDPGSLGVLACSCPLPNLGEDSKHFFSFLEFGSPPGRWGVSGKFVLVSSETISGLKIHLHKDCIEMDLISGLPEEIRLNVGDVIWT